MPAHAGDAESRPPRPRRRGMRGAHPPPRNSDQTMKNASLHLILALGLAAAGTTAGATEGTMASVGRGVKATEDAVKRGGSAVSEGLQQGVKAVNEGADSVARKLGLPAGTAADARRAQESSQRKADVHPDPSTEPAATPARQPAARPAPGAPAKR